MTAAEVYRSTLHRREKRLRYLYADLGAREFNAAGLRLLEVAIKATAADWSESFRAEIPQ